MVNIKFIIGSTRPNRFGPTIADWLQSLAAERTDANFEIIDLAKVNLPLFDEPQSPMAAPVTKDHSKAWAEQIAAADGFVMITPEYNHGTSAALKNAIDFLFYEWHHKPVAFTSYGADAGGARAVEHLRGNVAQVKMYSLFEHVTIANYWEQFSEQGAWTPTDRQVADAKGMLDALVFWAEHMKTAREQLAEQTKQAA